MRTSRLAAHRAKLLLIDCRAAEAATAEEEADPRPEMLCFRGQTLALIRHFFEISSQVGRVSSLLGREFFRAKCSSYRLVTFEDAVIFVHDVEHCLDRLDWFERQILARIVLQGHDQGQTAWLLHTDRRTIEHRYPEALDSLTEIFLSVGMMTLLPMHEPGCQPPALHDCHPERGALRAE